MRVVPIRGFPHDRRGQLAAGKVYEFDDAEAKRLILIGLVRQASPDEYETKVVSRKPNAGPLPSLAVGEAQPSSASQAAQASQQTTVTESECGDSGQAASKAEKKRKRKLGE
ncbi:hypothetical protein [Lysobacter antibioticus]|uniref:hypothetical protein n=1 Tax=Lysobacter antibioticus TaxID=84531 RepID=UPI0011402108|nr:hypothetical protein [Lysobacter antibioticus]